MTIPDYSFSVSKPSSWRFAIGGGSFGSTVRLHAHSDFLMIN